MKTAIKHPKVGQWARVIFTDVGARDGICISRDNGKEFRFLAAFGNDIDHVEDTQVLELGCFFEGQFSGLSSK